MLKPARICGRIQIWGNLLSLRHWKTILLKLEWKTCKEYDDDNSNNRNNYYYYYYYYYYYCYYYFTLLRVFHSSISWWFFTGVWVTASLQDSSQYSGQSQQCCSLDGFHSSSYLQVFQFYINLLVTVPSAPRPIGITITFVFYSFFSTLARSTY